MPLPKFVRLHPEAKVTSEELATLKAYLAPWAPAPAQSSNASASNVFEPVSPATVQPEFNGIPFDPNFKSWKPISTTDPGDNNTFRFVLGNDVAVQAAQSGNISPWPDGTRFAKIAWQQETGADSLVHPGKFVQVELRADRFHPSSNAHATPVIYSLRLMLRLNRIKQLSDS